MNKALTDFAQNPLSYDLHEMMDDEEIREMTRDVEALRKELYESAGRNRNFHVKGHQPHHGGRLQCRILLSGEVGWRLGQRLALHRRRRE